MNKKKVTVFGGTFDPPTLMHELIMRTCLEDESVDEVWVMPSGQRVDKPNMQTNQVRLEMLNNVKKYSFASNSRLVVSDFEMNLPQPSNTYATWQALIKVYPDVDFGFIFGTDSYDDMPFWEHGDVLRQELRMLLIARGGVLPAESKNIKHLVLPDTGIGEMSSTMVRESVRAGRPIEAFVSSKLLDYIRNKQCYQH